MLHTVKKTNYAKSAATEYSIFNKLDTSKSYIRTIKALFMR